MILRTRQSDLLDLLTLRQRELRWPTTAYFGSNDSKLLELKL